MDRRGCLAHLHLHCQLPLTPAGWNKRIEYAPGAGSLALFPGIRLETCDEPLWNIQATIELQTNHVAKGCDRDNYSERALRKLCGGCAPLGSPGLSPVAPTPSLCLKLLCLFLNNLSWEFPGSPGGRTLHSHCRGSRFHPGSGN